MATKVSTFNTVAGLNKALRKLPKLATGELRDASVIIAERVASKARAKATGKGGAAALVAPSIRAGRDRVPLIRMGNSTRLPARDGKPRTGKRQTIGDLIYGAEFGSRRFTQFEPPTKPGYFLWNVVQAESAAIQDEYSDALLDALNKVK